MEEAAKEVARNVFASNVGAIVAIGVFAVFIGFCLWVGTKWSSRQQVAREAAADKRDKAMMDKFADIEKANREVWKASTDHFVKVTEEQHHRAEEQHQQFIELLSTTVETVGGLGEAVRGLDRTVSRLEDEVKKKVDRPEPR